MCADLKKEHLSLKMQTNVTNNRGMSLMLAAEMIQEYRNLVQQLNAHIDKLHAALNEKENSQRDGGAVPTEAPKVT